MLREVHKILRIYLTLYPTSKASECTFSSLKRLKDRQNNCILMHCHKLITDTLDTASVEMAKRVASANEKSAQRVFWKISVGVWHG